jgi:hypothetical protein
MLMDATRPCDFRDRGAQSRIGEKLNYEGRATDDRRWAVTELLI